MSTITNPALWPLKAKYRGGTQGRPGSSRGQTRAAVRKGRNKEARGNVSDEVRFVKQREVSAIIGEQERATREAIHRAAENRRRLQYPY